MNDNIVHIIGGGLAGSEAAWQLVNNNIKVILHEMRPVIETPVHKTDLLAELVCSNSFRSDDYESNAVGLLHQEMRVCNSLIMSAADQNKVPAGSALAVDREKFSFSVSKALYDHPLLEIKNEEVKKIPDEWKNIIISSGPLTSEHLSNYILSQTDSESLAFFDAIAPIVYKESINMDVCWYQSRYDKVGPGGNGLDYINCPMNEKQYFQFIEDLIAGESTEFHHWELSTPYFEGCLPIEVMAKRGKETLRFGPMKPVGLTNKHNVNVKPYAVVQLRQDNQEGTLYNIVGFQTKLKYNEQTKVLRNIPGLEDAKFARLGGMHRNTYIKSPILLDKDLSLSTDRRIKFAGQITGVEGYVESASIGLLAGKFMTSKILNKKIIIPPKTTALGSLLNYITTELKDKKDNAKYFQPMNINYGLIETITNEPIPKLSKKEKSAYTKKLISKRALLNIQEWLNKQ
ncbi:MAG: methylenetetrahydrofolate--tRNA-(uracil(54)-C(5))-methyltransferase (FADH(2)-oxidizing) TrmFO [Alphaproteobacteria bacterium]|jgi:methylenetetrahydrofolate--tRNA-(uracil-5-)-methyltransferase|nr:methylenetetrahydrofolate--tRNA-(uracil(54)-C(5))-methyltransferase (FADH(2)-oxidizing) TrmFO [Hyphomicrobiales bacterium]|tara:strand:- start:8612 stop:9988 length:1377 start_codon:yes stop_codon:yes gene_type:complete